MSGSGTDKRNPHRAGYDPPYAEATSEGSVNLIELLEHLEAITMAASPAMPRRRLPLYKHQGRPAKYPPASPFPPAPSCRRRTKPPLGSLANGWGCLC